MDNHYCIGGTEAHIDCVRCVDVIEEELTPAYPFCLTCHGTGGTWIAASYTSPEYFDACPKCDGKTSGCDAEECWCRSGRTA
jgi:hypothetical protein